MKKYLSISLMALIPTVALAETAPVPEVFQPHAYLDATIGAAKAVDGCDGIGNDECDDTDTGVRLAFGYQMNQQGFFELGYIDFGETTYDFSNSFDVEDATAKAAVTALYGVGGVNIPVEYVEFFGKAGFALAKVEITADSTSIDGRSFSPIISGGIHIPVAKHFGLVAQMDYLLNAGDEDETGQSDMFMVSAGARLSF